MLLGRPLSVETDSRLRDALISHVNVGAHPASLVNELLALAAKVKQLVQESDRKDAEYVADTEELRLELFKHRKEGTEGGLQQEFDRSEEISRLQDQVGKLKKTIEFYRVKERQPLNDQEIDSYEEYLSDTIHLPSSNVTHLTPEGTFKPAPPTETIASQLLAMLQNKDVDSAGKYFWLLISNQRVLQQRIVKAVAVIKELHQKQVWLIYFI